MNYDAWFDYLRLLEADGNMEQIRETYERAIANIPPSKVGACIALCVCVVWCGVVWCGVVSVSICVCVCV